MADLFMGASSPHSSLPDETAERARARVEEMLTPTGNTNNAGMAIPLSQGFNAGMSMSLSQGFNAGMSMPLSHGLNAGMYMPLSQGFNAGMPMPLSYGFNAGMPVPLSYGITNAGAYLPPSHGFNTAYVNNAYVNNAYANTEPVNAEFVNAGHANTNHANNQHVNTNQANAEHANTKHVNTERGPAEPTPKKCKTGGGGRTPAAPVVKYDKTKLYPPGLKRVLKLDQNTFGINTAPLADDTPWSKIGVPAIREQLDIRGVATDGIKSEIINRIKNWRKYVDLEKEVVLNYRVAFQLDKEERFFARSNAANRTTKWLPIPSDGTWENYLEVNEEDFKMCVLKREDLPWTDGLPNVYKDSATFTIGTFCINTYEVIIGPQCYCTCPSKKFHPVNHCVHILYVLMWVMRCPDELVYQHGYLPSELTSLFTKGPMAKLRPSQATILADPTMRDGRVKFSMLENASEDCPICFRKLDGDDCACCRQCGRITHWDCYEAWKKLTSPQVRCPTCMAKWEDPRFLEADD